MQKTDLLLDCCYLTYSTDLCQMHFGSTEWPILTIKHAPATGQKTLIQFLLLVNMFYCFQKQAKAQSYFCSPALPTFTKIPCNSAWSVVTEVFGLYAQSSGYPHFLRLMRDLDQIQTCSGLHLDRGILTWIESFKCRDVIWAQGKITTMVFHTLHWTNMSCL